MNTEYLLQETGRVGRPQGWRMFFHGAQFFFLLTFLELTFFFDFDGVRTSC